MRFWVDAAQTIALTLSWVLMLKRLQSTGIKSQSLTLKNIIIMSTKPALDDKIVEILTSIQSALSATGDYASKQLPDIANQYIAYNRVSLTLGYVICIAFIISVVTFIYKNSKHFDYEDEPTMMFLSVFCLLPAFVSFMLVLFNFNNLIMVWFAPKLYLVYEIKNLLAN